MKIKVIRRPAKGQSKLDISEVVPIHGNSSEVNVVRDGKKVRKVSAFHFPKELTDNEKAKLVALFK